MEALSTRKVAPVHEDPVLAVIWGTASKAPKHSTGIGRYTAPKAQGRDRAPQVVRLPTLLPPQLPALLPTLPV